MRIVKIHKRFIALINCFHEQLLSNEVVEQIADSNGCGKAQVLLKWALQQSVGKSNDTNSTTLLDKTRIDFEVTQKLYHNLF